MELLKKSIKLYGLMIVASFMCFILVMSFNMMGTVFLTSEIGYTVYGSEKEGEELKELYTHYYADGDDKKEQEYTDKNYTLSKVVVRSEIDKKSGMIYDIVTQIFLIFMSGVFVYNNLWNLGNKDKNAVKHGQKQEDKLKGLKIGSIVMIPSVVLLTVLAIGKNTFAKDISIALFAFLNTHLYEGIILISGGGGLFSSLAVWQIICYYAMFVIIPVIAAVAYVLGYKDVIVSERLVFKKK